MYIGESNIFLTSLIYINKKRPPTMIIGIPTTAPTTVTQARAPNITSSNPVAFLIGLKDSAAMASAAMTIIPTKF